MGELSDCSATGPLVRVLRVDEGHLSSVAARALGELGDPAANQALLTVLGDPTASHELSGYAAGALGKIGHAQTVGPLIALTRSGAW